MKNCFSISNGKLYVNQIPLLEDVPENIFFHTFPSTHLDSSTIPQELFYQVTSRSHKGGFISFTKPEHSHRHTNSLGRFNGRRFLSIFRFQSWWSTMWIGYSGSDLQKETMWILMDLPETNSYVTIVPIISGSFRSAIHPGDNSDIIICVESGSTQVQSKLFNCILYVHVGANPYNLIKKAFAAIRVHLNTFRLLEEKALPRIADKFGWCTWDGFHQSVNPIGIWHGVRNFSNQGLSLRFLIIDDGWQSVNFDIFDAPRNCLSGRTRIPGRLYSYEECNKFMSYIEGSLLRECLPCFDIQKHKVLVSKLLNLEETEMAYDEALKSGLADALRLESRIEDMRNELDELVKEEEYRGKEFNNSGLGVGLKAFTQDLRTRFRSLDDIYVWQALCGYWGGVRPGATQHSTKLIPAKSPPGLDQAMIDSASVNLVRGSIGLVDPYQANEFYDLMHSHLAKAGVTGVKMDVMNTLEFVSEGYGGRVELAKAYYQGLTQSIMKNFNGTGVLSSMQQCNDFIFLGTQQISMGRAGANLTQAGDDFWAKDPHGDVMGSYWLQGVHMVHSAYNSLWLGHVILPDWDMFRSDHVCSEFHAASRAICGGPIYVSDPVGSANFNLLKKLVFSDGSVPKCINSALPTRDCLFKYPLSDSETMLKIWNLNKVSNMNGDHVII